MRLNLPRFPCPATTGRPLAGLLLVAAVIFPAWDATGGGIAIQSAPAKKGTAPIETYQRGKSDKLELAVRADGTADMTIDTQSPRGVCSLALTGARQAPGTFVFKDKESSCSVTLAVTDKAVNVGSSGNCSNFCGVHSSFTGTYIRTGKPAPKGADPAFAPVSIEQCGKPLVMDVKNPAQFRQFGVDLAAFRKNEAAKYAELLESLCKSSTKYRAIVESKIDRIDLVNAQGAMEPTLYIRNKALIIEFFGGSFDAKDFDRSLRRALEGKPPVFRD